MRRCPQPIICLAHGATTGGGLAFALASDVRIISDDAKINVAMVKVGLTGCDVGISYFLPRSVGQSVAAELMMTGRFITPDRALSLGLSVSSCQSRKSKRRGSWHGGRHAQDITAWPQINERRSWDIYRLF